MLHEASYDRTTPVLRQMRSAKGKLNAASLDQQTVREREGNKCLQDISSPQREREGRSGRAGASAASKKALPEQQLRLPRERKRRQADCAAAPKGGERQERSEGTGELAYVTPNLEVQFLFLWKCSRQVSQYCF